MTSTVSFHSKLRDSATNVVKDLDEQYIAKPGVGPLPAIDEIKMRAAFSPFYSFLLVS